MKENHVPSSVINDQNMRILNKILGDEIQQSFLKECKMFHRGPGNRGPSECGTTHEATSGMSS